MIPPVDSFWSDEKVAELRKLSAEGIGAYNASRLLGTSPNAVISKKRRLGIETARMSREVSGGTGEEHRARNIAASERVRVTVPLDEKEGKGCRYIIEEPARRYCCEPTKYGPEGFVWCAHHRSVVYEPRKLKPVRAA